MSSLLRTVRIIHSPEEMRYYVQYKNVWSFRWKVDEVVFYNRETFPSEMALKEARKRAEVLLCKTVVWEQTNYTWW